MSRYDGEIDWRALRQAGFSFAFIRATQGEGIIDLKFSEDWIAAKQAGFVVGAYHFFVPSHDAAKQAEHFLAQAPLSVGDLPAALDVEDNP